MRDGLVDGRFRLTQPLGRGPRGEVWQALDEHAGRQPVALKLFSGTTQPHQAIRIDSPNVIQTFSGGTDNGVPYVVMELVDGVSLATVLEEGPLHGDDAKAIAAGVAIALHAAHAGGVVHGNLKASNVLIGEHGVVKVGDFSGHGDPREDMYSLGVLMEAMAGRRDPVVDRLLSRNPHSPAKLYRILTGQPLPGTSTGDDDHDREPEQEPEPERPKLMRLAVISGLATLVLVIAGCVWLLMPSAGPRIESQDPPPATDAAQPTDQPSAAPQATTQDQVTTGAPAAAGTGVSAVKAVVAGQLKAGQIQAGAAATLNDKLDEVGRFLSRGQTKQANDRIDTLKAQLAAQRQANAVTADGYNAILAAVDRLT